MDVRIDTQTLPLANQVPDLPDIPEEAGALTPVPANDGFDTTRDWVGGVGSVSSAVGRVLELGSVTAGPAIGGLGSIVGILNGLAGIPRAAVRAEAREQLRQALNIHVDGHGDSARQLAAAYARAAVLTEMSDAEMARMRSHLPADAFDTARASIEGFRREHPDAYRQLQRVYREHLQAWQDGLAAGLLGGLPDVARGPSFVEAHRIAGQALTRREDWAVRGRATMQRSRDDGFVAAARGTIDAERMRRDAAYRSGVTEANAIRREQGPGGVQRAAAELVAERNRNQHASLQRPVRG